jgi:hypothetical protein
MVKEEPTMGDEVWGLSALPPALRAELGTQLRSGRPPSPQNWGRSFGSPTRPSRENGHFWI